MLATLTWKKWDYIIDEGEQPGVDPDLKGDRWDARKLTKSEIQELKLSTAFSIKKRFMDVPVEEFSAFLVALETSSRDGSMTRKMREELAIARTLDRMWACSVESTRPEELIYMSDNHAKLKRHAIMVRNAKTESPAVNVELTQIYNDARRAEFAPMPEIANQTEQSVSLLETALRSLGITLNDADDESKRFSEALVLSNGETIAQLCKQASSADNRGASEVEGTAASDILCLLRRELSHTGLKLLTHRAHSRSRRSDQNPDGEAPSYSLMTDEDVARVVGKLRFGGVDEIERVAHPPDSQRIVLSGGEAVFAPPPPPTDFDVLILAQATIDEVDLIRARDVALKRIDSEPDRIDLTKQAKQTAIAEMMQAKVEARRERDADVRNAEILARRKRLRDQKIPPKATDTLEAAWTRETERPLKKARTLVIPRADRSVEGSLEIAHESSVNYKAVRALLAASGGRDTSAEGPFPDFY
jgi:hypothetical protein